MNKVHLTASRHVVEVMIAAWMGLPMTASAKEIKPTSDTQVLEKLAPRLSNSGNPALAANPQVRLAQAQEAIRLARQTSDPRHLGRAQVALAPWWDRSDAPVEAAVLQATVQQSRHEFAVAQRVLAGALTREPKPGQASLSPGSQSSGSQSPAWQSQGWLTLANLERVTGRYSASLKACDQVAAAGA